MTRVLLFFPTEALQAGAPALADSQLGPPIASNDYELGDEQMLASPYRELSPLVDELWKQRFRSEILPRMRSGPSRASLYLVDGDFDCLGDGPASRHIIVIAQQDAVLQLGGLFFWRTILRKGRFSTKNVDLFRAEYLPTQLAKEGRGVFFEERVGQRLATLGLVTGDADIQTIEDEGGWANLDELTATLRVTFMHEGTLRGAELLATALVPFPPMTPTALCALIEERSRFFSALGIRSAVLLAERGVTFHRGLLPSVDTQNRPVMDT